MAVVAAPVEVRSPERAQALASAVLNPQRRLPLVVVCSPEGGSGVVDIGELAAAIGFSADVALLPQRLADDFNAALPASIRVYGDVVRVYPVAASWDPEPPACEYLPAATPTDRARGLRQVLALVDRARHADPGSVAAPAGAGSSTGMIPRTPGEGTRPPGTVQHVASAAGVEDLAALLLTPGRQHPVVVITVPAGQAQPWIDADRVARELAGQAWVFQVPTGRLTYALSDHLGAMQGVYGGAGRVYSGDLAWKEDPYRSPLRLVRDLATGQEATDGLIGDALGAASLRGQTHRWATADTAGVEMTGVVQALVGDSRALVRLDDGQVATVWAETVGTDITHLVTVGQPVTGLLDESLGRLDITDSVREPAEITATWQVGDVVLTQVVAVTATELTLRLVPGVTVTLGVDQVTGNDLDHLDDLASIGEVLTARITARPGPSAPARAGWALSLLDVDPDTAPSHPAPALLPGGPPWLAPHQPAHPPTVHDHDSPPLAPAPRPAPVPPTPPPVTPPPPAADSEPAPGAAEERRADLLAEHDDLVRTIRAQQVELARLRADNERLRTINRAGRAQRRTPERTDTGYGFSDPVEQLRWEVLSTWVTQTLPADKARYALPEQWHIGPDFLNSLTLEGVPRAKVLSVVVHVLTGRYPKDTHPLRRDQGGSTPQVTRHDGATCWRVPLQQHTPAARRLHYWRLPDGTIELSRIVAHDNNTP